MDRKLMRETGRDDAAKQAASKAPLKCSKHPDAKLSLVKGRIRCRECGTPVDDRTREKRDMMKSLTSWV